MAADSTTDAPKKSRRSTKKSSRGKGNTSRLGKKPPGAVARETSALFLIVAAIALFLALISFDITGGQNLIGPVGAFIADALLTVFGVGSFLIATILGYLGFCLLIGRIVEYKASEAFGFILFIFSGTLLFHLALEAYIILGHRPGGLIGEFSAEITRSMLGTAGVWLLASSMLLVSLMLSTSMSLAAIARAITGSIHRTFARMNHDLQVYRTYRARLREERARLRNGDRTIDELVEEQIAAEEPLAKKTYEFQENFEEEVESKLKQKLGRLFKRSDRGNATDKVADVSAEANEKISMELERDEDWEFGDLPGIKEDLEGDGFEPDVDESGQTEEMDVQDSDILDLQDESRPSSSAVDVDFGPQIVESDATKRARAKKEMLESDDAGGLLFAPQRRGAFELPPIRFLNYDRDDDVVIDREELRKMAAQIEKTLADFKVDGQVVEICPGPVITMFEFSPAPGVKISRIAGLSDDLAMALAAYSVRIVAPIPGKGVVGIEVPNPKRQMVFLKEIIADDVFRDDTKMQLPLALGVNTQGAPIVADLARMPHLLVAGATGSGKSVAVNTMICSLLYKHSPDDVKMIMVDPKMLEFSTYADIPHLLLPVVTDPKQATVALNWTVQEMERRYQKLADMGVRNITGYNKKVDGLTERATRDRDQGLEESQALRALGIDHNGKPEHVRLPFLIVIIDEFADLMMTASKDVETAVARLAQKARAAGIHLILATQRPSTDVITGLIKANFPTRVALRVTSKTDSRVILDSNGAENLLGNGDMLFVPPGSSALTRVHGAYVSEKELDQVVDFLKDQGDPIYDESILASDEENDLDNGIDESERDEHYHDALQLVLESKQASISMIQRKLRVGYNRAARMVEMMEVEGYVSPADGCKPREVLIDELPI